jgi:hypothetical protein
VIDTGDSEDKSVGVWDIKTFKFYKRLRHDKAVKSVVGANNVALTGSIDGSVKVSSQSCPCYSKVHIYLYLQQLFHHPNYTTF